MLILPFCFSIGITLSGFLFFDRIFRIFSANFPLKKSFLTKIGTFYFCISILSLFLLNQSPALLIFFFVIANISIPILFFVLRKIRQSQFQSEFVRFCSGLLLKMKIGVGFRQAYRQMLAERPWKHQHILRDIYENVAFSQQKRRSQKTHWDEFLGRWQETFFWMDRNPSSGLSILEESIKALKIQTNFRRRSREIWRQILTQVLVVGGLYFALLLFIGREFGFSEHRKPILWSAFFFVIGLLLLFRLGRPPRWKI